MAETRLLPPAQIPNSLWDSSSKTLRLPPALAAAYEHIVDSHDLRHLAKTRDPKNPPAGGLSQEQTDNHLAQAFDGSVARIQLALLDPKSDIPQASNAFLKCLAGNAIVLTDTPCGSGAAAAAFLTNIAELRKCEVLPREPLDIVLIGAEPSEPARNYAAELLTAIEPTLAAQGIFVKKSIHTWDVTCDVSTTDLVKRMTLAANGCSAQLLVIANFSAFLERAGKWKKAKPQIGELFRYASGKNSVAVWIEPEMNRVTKTPGGMFERLRKLITGDWRGFVRGIQSGDRLELVGTSFAKFHLPLEPGQTANVRLAVISMDLLRSK